MVENKGTCPPAPACGRQQGWVGSGLTSLLLVLFTERTEDLLKDAGDFFARVFGRGMQVGEYCRPFGAQRFKHSFFH